MPHHVFNLNTLSLLSVYKFNRNWIEVTVFHVKVPLFDLPGEVNLEAQFSRNQSAWGRGEIEKRRFKFAWLPTLRLTVTVCYSSCMLVFVFVFYCLVRFLSGKFSGVDVFVDCKLLRCVRDRREFFWCVFCLLRWSCLCG